jgi:two-component system response regulator AtoC
MQSKDLWPSAWKATKSKPLERVDRFLLPEGAPDVAEHITEAARLLVVSRESAVLRPLWSIAESNSWQIETAPSAWDAIERLQSGAIPHLLLLDLSRGDNDSLHILRWMRRLRPDLPVIVICSPEDAGRKREVTQIGAQEVLILPFDDAGLECAIHRHLIATNESETEISSEDIEQLGPDAFFISASPVTQKLRAQAELLAEADVPVLILGEAGSGKDTVARLIHKLSVRSGFQFLKVNCADMPGDLLEAEIFGNERGSLPGGGRNGHGKIQRAEKGTIFLDEITEMPAGLQAKLMEVLQGKALSRSGGEKVNALDVRIIAATSASIDRAVAERKLREDLYYRLSAFTVQVPPLRQRKGEIAVLLQYWMHQLARHYGLPTREYSANVLNACQQYSWPGNLEQLQNFVKRYLVAGDAELVFNDLGSDPNSGISAQHIPGESESTTEHRAIRGHHDQSGPKSLKSLIQNVRWETERNAIGTALQKTGWNRKAAARLLQVSYRTLLYKIDQYQMTSSESFVSPMPGGKFSLQGATTRGNGKEQ